MPKESLPSVFVRGLAYSTTEEALTAHFSELAPVKRAIIVRDKATHESRGFGFVQLCVGKRGHGAADTFRPFRPFPHPLNPLSPLTPSPFPPHHAAPSRRMPSSPPRS
jgi:hypothetical protein